MSIKRLWARTAIAAAVLTAAFALLPDVGRAGEKGGVRIVPPAPPEPGPFIPRLRTPGAERPVRLQSLAVRAELRGGFAEIGLDMLFSNPNDRVLEGELQFPLLPGQEISGLALDVGGEMRDGVPVPKARGQEIFETVIRSQADPALLEATQGNAYRLRLYPIPAKGTRRAAVRVLQPLEERDGMFTFRLPLDFAENIETFSVEVLVAADSPPRVESASLGLVLRQAGLLYRGKAERTDFSPEGWLVVSVPAPAAPDKGLNAVRWKDKVYFTATASLKARVQKRTLPGIVTLVWDASGSGRDRDHAREYALLDEYFAALGDGLARLVVVRDAAEEPREFTIRQGDWSELKAHLHRLAYDGGTNLSSWKPAADCGEYLLFTDGRANFGAGLDDGVLPAMLPGQRLYAIVASTAADRNLLSHASQGRLIDLLRTDGGTAARLLLEDRTRAYLAPEDLAGKGEALLDPLGVFAEPGANRLQCRLAGWVKARENAGAETISLRLEHPDGSRESLSLAVPLGGDIPRHTGGDAPLAARLWGRYAIADLEADANRNRAAILRLGREFGVVSRETSLIVLETAADYARHDVEPPAALKAEVERLRGRDDIAAGRPTYLPMAELERRWNKKVAWWETEFPKKDDGKKTKEPNPEFAPESAGITSGWEADAFDSAPSSPAPASVMRSAQPVMMADAAVMADSVAGDSALRSDAAAPSPRASPDQPGGTSGGGMDVVLQPWRSNAPYIERMNRAAKEEMYAIYLDERPGYERNAGFFMDMADRFFAADMPGLGLRVLSNLAEIEAESRQFLRVLAYRLLEAGEMRLALGILEKVRELAPHEPQSLRDLALAHQGLGNRRQAAELLYETARRAWDER
ncbi:MAG: hypothetical protein LBT97_09510, partial [Planctomycetota bacterium]|nr:hypothetical protein [Planctomycetota bacterium]